MLSKNELQDVISGNAEVKHGKILITRFNKKVTAGKIVETEAYSYIERGCHAYRGMTPRNASMFLPGGVAYVYLCYGIHRLFNVVTNEQSFGDAVLIRAVEPIEGMEIMKKRSNVDSERRITSGPGKLTKAMGIELLHDQTNLTKNEIWIEDHAQKISLVADRRIGLESAGKEAIELNWRFTEKNNAWVSVKPKQAK